MLHAIRERREYDEKMILSGAHQWEVNELYKYMEKVFPYGDWKKISSTVSDIANKCNAELEKGEFPVFVSDTGEASKEVILKKCKEGISRLKLKGAGKIYNDRIKKELQLIESKGFIDYILIAADFIEWAKTHGVLVGGGRGSSAGSLVCYLLGITVLDPIKYDLMFERFIDENRTDPPDIDTDFDAERRDLVKEYAKQKYGEEFVCDVATFAKFKGKNSLDEIGKMFQIPKFKVETVKDYLIERAVGDARAEKTIEDTFGTVPEATKIANEHPDILNACLLEGQLRHIGTHAAGVLISTKPLHEVLALYKKEEKIVGSLEMKDASSVNLIKIDFLGLIELTVLREIYEMLGKNMMEIYNIPLDDAATLKAFNDADVYGVFQFEGDSTRNILKQMPYVDFEQLISCVTLSKPGPSRSGSATKYIAKMRGHEKVECFDWHPILADITSKTYGQIIYQEQIIRILREFADFSAADANKCRAVVAKSKGEQEFDKYFPLFEKGSAGKVSPEQAKHLWESMKSFGRYAFNRAHAASYAVLGYWSMYMKVHHPAEFYICKLKHEDDKSKKVRLLNDAVKRGFEILPPVLGKSGKTWAKEGDKKLRAGLMDIKNIGEKTAERLIEEKYTCHSDFNRKVKGINVGTLKTLEINKCFEEDEHPDDFFKIHSYDVLDKIAPNRTKAEDIKESDDSYNLTVAGKIIEIKQKDVRGATSGTVLQPDKNKYAILFLEDETEKMYVIIDRFMFSKFKDDLKDAKDNEKFVIVSGVKSKGSKIVRAKRILTFSEESVKED
jgi:DNA polymerase-3 subunit alpha